MRNVGGVNHKTVVQVVVIQSISETLRLIKSKTYYKEEKQVLRSCGALLPPTGQFIYFLFSPPKIK